MRDNQKTKAKLLQELDTLRRHVSELKQAAKEQARTIDATPVLVFVQDKDFRFVKVNKSVCDLLKVKSQDLIGKKCYEVLHKSDKPWPNCPLAKVLKEKRPHTEEVYDPNIGIPLLITISPLFDENGELTSVVHVATDITDRKKVEEVLSESEQRYRDIFNSATDAIFILDLENNIVDANPEACEMFGYSRDEMIELAAHKLVHPDYRRKPEEFRNEIETKGRIYFEAVNLRKDGTQLNVAVRGTMFAHNGKKHFLVTLRDVTEHKWAEEALRESQRQKQAILDSIPDIAWLKDKEGRYIAANEALCRAFSVKLEDLVGKTDFYISPEDLAERYRADDEEVMKSGERKRIEEPWGKKNSRRIWIETIKTPIYNNKGEVVGTSGIARDITERKLAEGKLRAFEERFRGLAERSFDLIFMTDAQGYLTYISDASEKILDYKPEEMVGTHFTNYLIESEIPRFSQHFAENMRGENLGVFQMEAMRKNGSGVFIELNSAPIVKNGETIGIQGIIRDITERKKAEEALRESEERLRVALSAAQMGTWRWDPVTNQDTRDASLNLILGLEAVESTQPVEDFLHFVHPEDRDMVDKEIQRAICERRAYVAEFRIIRPDGTVRWLRDQGKLLYDENNRILCLTGAVIDITELRRREEELNIYRENIIQAEELATVGTLSATLAHELTQPLTVIGLSIGNSLAELEKMSCPDTVVEDLKEGLSEVSSMTSMVGRFRNFARMSTKRTVSEVDCKAVAERIVKLLDESAWRAKVTLQVKGMDKLPLIYSYERDLEQLFFSLIENAIQAADGKKKRRVIISGVVRDGNIELQFSDNCSGIAPENLDRIFEPFFTTRHAGERTGLGLCVVERIVSQLGGQVRVESKLGKGSTFFVTLPTNRVEMQLSADDK